MTTPNSKTKNYLIACGVVGIIICIILACISWALSSSEPNTAEEYMQEYGGKAEVYNRILSLTDCVSLQNEFNQAESNLNLQAPGTPQYKWGLGYMAASNNRMKELGCDKASNSLPASSQPAINTIVKTTIAASSSTPYILPTLTPAGTLAIFETGQPTTPFIFIFPTPTFIIPVDQPTATTFVLPTNPPVSGSCLCTGDLYNCTRDFSTHAQAQACFNYCIAQGVGDIHQLDGNDHDGLACESLP